MPEIRTAEEKLTFSILVLPSVVNLRFFHVYYAMVGIVT
jgi:hypothetical protein